jgi:predicted permease
MKHALRTLAREKAFAAFAILTLALGIGGVTTIFSVVDGALLKPLAYREPGRLYAATESVPQLAAMYPRLPVNAAHFRAWQQQCRSCESAALVNPATFNLTGEGDPERIEGATCTWPLFEVLGITPQLGRTFAESHDQPGANKFVVISDSLWRRRLSADPAIVGKPIRLNGDPHVVLAVLRADFRFPSGDQLGPLNQFPKRAEIFKPMGFDWSQQRRSGSFNYASIIRLRPGANPARAEAEMTAAVADAGREMKVTLTSHLTPLQEQVTGSSRSALILLLGAVGVVLLIVCVNLGNLMLVRANERSRDAAIRRALGAGSGDLFRPLLTESLLIAFAGGALGVLVAFAGVRLLVNTAPVDIPRLDEVRISWTTLLFAFGVSAGCGILCGLMPAIRAIGAHPVEALRSGTRSATVGRSGQWSREWLVGLEVALSTVLLVMAALLGLSFFRVATVERGYGVDHILTADLNLPGSRYPKDEQRASFHERALAKVATLPGVRSAGLVSSLPLKAQVWGDMITKEGDTRPMAERPVAHYRFVSEDYFETMGVALRQGRFPTLQDRTRKVAVLSESSARKVWPGENPIGKILQKDPKAERVEVIGVVADIRTESLEKQAPMMVYVPYWDGKYWQGNVWGNATYVLRTSQDPETMANALRAAMREMDAELPLANILTMRQIMSESVGGRRFQTILAAVFAGTALLLACLGIYGVISYSVSRRTNEMGIRIALGAQASQVSMLVLRQGVRPVAGGLLVGVAAALAAGQWISSFLFGTEARDPLAISAVVSLLLLVATIACWAPARRASRLDPMVALRDE